MSAHPSYRVTSNESAYVKLTALLSTLVGKRVSPLLEGPIQPC